MGDIEACLGVQPEKLMGMGLRMPIAKSTLADANELRDWRIGALGSAYLSLTRIATYHDDETKLRNDG